MALPCLPTTVNEQVGLGARVSTPPVVSRAVLILPGKAGRHRQGFVQSQSCDLKMQPDPGVWVRCPHNHKVRLQVSKAAKASQQMEHISAPAPAPARHYPQPDCGPCPPEWGGGGGACSLHVCRAGAGSWGCVCQRGPSALGSEQPLATV